MAVGSAARPRRSSCAFVGRLAKLTTSAPIANPKNLRKPIPLSLICANGNNVRTGSLDPIMAMIISAVYIGLSHKLARARAALKAGNRRVIAAPKSHWIPCVERHAL
jgi:hypothetical protein